MTQLARYSFIPEHQTDSQFDHEYTASGENGFMRGGRVFKRPTGWKKIALKVSGKYENDVWLGVGERPNEKQSLNGEWPISYHGPKDINTIAAIINNGYDINLNIRSAYGKGIYSSPTPETAQGYAGNFNYNGKRISVIIMNRYHPSYTKVENGGNYLVTTNDRMIRPIAILIKEA